MLFYNEHLTPKNQGRDKYVIWTKNGQVLGKPKEGGTTFRLKSKADVEELKQKMDLSKKRTIDERSPQQEEPAKKTTKEKLKQFQNQKY